MKKTGSSFLLLSIIILVVSLVTPSFAMTVDPLVKETVAFVFLPDQEHSGKFIPQGTGFFIAVKSTDNPETSFGYFVTAKHVFQNKDKKDWITKIYVRLNKQDNTSEYIPIDLFPKGERKNIFTSTDPTVDIAIIPAKIDHKKYKVRFLGEEFLTTKSDFGKFNIKEGTEVFFTGLFTSHIGEQRNYPIVRFGRVALIPEEKIRIEENIKTDLYLIEANAYGGNSGSPVFFHFGVDRTPGSITVGPPLLKLAGVISLQFWDEIPVKFIPVPRQKSKKTSQAEDQKIVPIVNPNVGIAGVVPAYRVQEILFGDELIEKRKQAR